MNLKPRIFENVRILDPYDQSDDWSMAERVICKLGSLFGTSPAGSTTTTTAPWSPLQPYLKQAFGQAQNLYNTGAKQVAPFNSAESGALTGMENLGANGVPITDAAMNFGTNLENGNYLNSNPYQDQTAQTVLSQVVPGIESQFAKGGALNNPMAAFATAQGATSALAPIEYQNYQDTLGKMVQGEALAPQTQQLPFQQLQQEFGAGQTQQGQTQQQLDLPFTQLQSYLSSLQGSYGSETTQPYFQNSAAGALGGLMGLQSLGGLSGIGSLFGLGGGAAAGAGSLGSAGIGSLLSLLAF